VKAVEGLRKVSGELGDERRERVEKIGASEKDAVARAEWLVVSQNVTPEVVKTNDGLVRGMGGLVNEGATVERVKGA
jgi:hypothetical protein